MPHLDLNVIGLIVLSLAAVVMWKMNQGGTGSAEIERAMSTGMLAMQQSNWAEATVYLERALQLLRNEEEPEIPKMVSCMVNLAQCYERSGKHKEAAGLFPQVISSWERYIRTSGASMVDIDYAASHSEFGRGTEAVAMFYIQKVIPIREQKFGQRHPEVLNSYTIAARLLRKLGRNQEADAYERKKGG